MSTLNGTAQTWRKSSHSTGDGGNCVEVRDDVPGAVPVRDSKDPAVGFLTLPAASWTSLTASLKSA